MMLGVSPGWLPGYVVIADAIRHACQGVKIVVSQGKLLLHQVAPCTLQHEPLLEVALKG